MIDSLQLTDSHSVATPVNWKDGDDVVIVPSLQDPEVLKEKFPKGSGAAAVSAHDAAAESLNTSAVHRAQTSTHCRCSGRALGVPPQQFSQLARPHPARQALRVWRVFFLPGLGAEVRFQFATRV